MPVAVETIGVIGPDLQAFLRDLASRIRNATMSGTPGPPVLASMYICRNPTWECHHPHTLLFHIINYNYCNNYYTLLLLILDNN